MFKPTAILFAFLIFNGQSSLDKCFGEAALAGLPAKLPLPPKALPAAPDLLGTVGEVLDGTTDLVGDVVGDGTLGAVGDLLKGTTDLVKDVTSLDLVKKLLGALGLGGTVDGVTDLVLVSLVKIKKLEKELNEVKKLIRLLLAILNLETQEKHAKIQKY